MAGIIDPLALFLALILATAAGHKLLAPDRLSLAAGNLLGLMPPLARAALFGAAALEAACALALAFPALRALGALLAVLLWAFYGAALFRARRRGAKAFDCGCTFSVQRHGISQFDQMRAPFLALLALIVAVFASGTASSGIEALFSALALFSLYLAASELAALPPIRRSIAP